MTDFPPWVLWTLSYHVGGEVSELRREIVEYTFGMLSFSSFIITRICGAVNNGFDHIAAAGQHEKYTLFWHQTNQELVNLISGEQESCQVICLSWCNISLRHSGRHEKFVHFLVYFLCLFRFYFRTIVFLWHGASLVVMNKKNSACTGSSGEMLMRPWRCDFVFISRVAK